MDKYEIAKELTIVALNNKYVINNVDDEFKKSYVEMNKGVANNVATFFNEIVNKINIED